MKNVMTIRRITTLHLLFLLYSVCGILGKLAAQQPLFSVRFFAVYAASLLMLAVYAILWQRILITLPLTTAFSNKGVTVVWGIVWGMLLFDESINLAKVVAAILIITGIAIIGKSEG